MERKFILSCGSTVDLPYSYCESRDIPVIFYTYVVDGKEYVDDMLRDPDALPHFYDMLRQGKLPHTSQVNTEAYVEFFDSLLEKGDVLHIAFGSGLSGSAHNARAAMETVAARHPDRTIRVVDSLAASSGHGMLVDYIADLRDNGASLEDAYRWAEKNKLNINHQFFSTDLTHLRRNGRVSGAAAMLGTMLGICPIMHLNADGRIIAYDKVRGKGNAVKVTARVMFERAVVVCDTRRTPSFVVYPEKGKPFTPRLQAGDGYLNEIKAFLAWVDGRSPRSPFEAQAARDSVAIVDAEKRSAATGKVVRL